MTTTKVDQTDRDQAQTTLRAAGSGLVAVGLAYVVLVVLPGNRTFVEAAQFAGTADRFSERLRLTEGDLSQRDATVALLLTIVFTVAWGAIGYYVFYGLKSPKPGADGKPQKGHWDAAWKASPGTDIAGRDLALVVLAGAGLGLVEKLLTLVALSSNGDMLTLRGDPILPAVIVTLSWAKWLIAASAIAGGLLMAVSAATAAIRGAVKTDAVASDAVTSDAVTSDDDAGDAEAHSSVDDDDASNSTGSDLDRSKGLVGICCSGGGIRSAGFCLGGLSALERVPASDGTNAGLGILGRADYLASVSGGGYAAAAWRILAGTGVTLPSEPLIGTPNDVTRKIQQYPDDNGAVDLIQHVRERRRFLANGRGGLPISAGIAVVRTVWHLLLLLLAVYLVVWPLGRLLVAWPITGVGRSAAALDNGFELELGVHQWVPPVALAGLGTLIWLARLRLGRTPARKRIDLAATGLAISAALLALILIVLPLAVDAFISLVNGAGGVPGGFVITGIYGAVLTAVWQFAKRRIAKVAKYLGGVLLAIGVLGFALFVMANAADSNGPFSSIWILPFVAAGLVIAMTLLNPDSWSLHSLYRTRLAGTFVTALTEDGKVVAADSEPGLAAFADDVAGPKPVLCCAVARKSRSHTGIPALSMTFEPSGITVYRWPDETAATAPDAEPISLSAFAERLPDSSDGERLAAPMGAAAVSGAAVAPSLGRMSLRSTNALLAAFNARLGVWLPNPRAKFTHKTTPRLVNMFKEIFGLFGDDDPNVYTTDGGHWENLGLVELIRRKCSVIICLDASGDPPGTYSTFRQAISLAALECSAEVTVSAKTWNEMAIDDYGICTKNYGLASVTYDDETTGQILYVKAAVMSKTSLPIQRYASADRTFPHYSTGDQFLTDAELDHLMQLGFESTNEALSEHVAIRLRAMGETAGVSGSGSS